MEALAPAASVIEEVDGDSEAVLPDETAQTDPGTEDQLGVDVSLPMSAQGRHGFTGGRVKKAKNRKGKEKVVASKRTERDEALMVTLVHGDMLVASGGVFEVCVRAFCCIDKKPILCP